MTTVRSGSAPLSFRRPYRRSLTLLASAAGVVGLLGLPGLALAGAAGGTPSSVGHPTTYNPGGDSATYLTSATRSSYNPLETFLSSSNAGAMKQLWAVNVGSTVYSQPAVVAGVAYLPTWGGDLYALNATNGTVVYHRFLGTQTACAGAGTAGIASSPSVVGPTLYVGGSPDQWFAVDTSNGTVQWSITTGTPSLGYYNWASPLIVGTEEYVGLASNCDHPLVPAAVLAINTTTHRIDARFNTTLNGSVGASEWSSPTYDPDLNQIFATTGNPGTSNDSKPYAESILALQPATMKLISSWEIPASAQIADGDFGATPTIVDVGHLKLVVAQNKDGYVYAWNRSNIAAGPVWQDFFKASDRNIASASFDGQQLYVGSGAAVTFQGKSFAGGLRAIDPVNGAVNWTVPLNGPVITAPYSANGLVAVEAGLHLTVIDTKDGKVLSSFTLPSGRYINAPLISHGILYAGANDGHLYAYGIPSSTTSGGGHGGHGGHGGNHVIRPGVAGPPTGLARWT